MTNPIEGKTQISSEPDQDQTSEQTYGAYLRELRTQRGLSQLELSRRSNLDPTYVSKIERGAYKPSSLKTIYRLAEALELDEETKLLLINKSGRNDGNLFSIPRALSESPIVKPSNIPTAETFVDSTIEMLLGQILTARRFGRRDIAQILLDSTTRINSLEDSK